MTPKLTQISVAVTLFTAPGAPTGRIVPGAPMTVQVNIIKSVVALDEEGRAWEFDSQAGQWVQIPHVFKGVPSEIPPVEELRAPRNGEYDRSALGAGEGVAESGRGEAPLPGEDEREIGR